MATRKRVSEVSEQTPKKRKVKEALDYHGLYNQGATCYLNSVLQVLFMTPELHHSLDPKPGTTDRELQKLFKKLKEGTCGTENITACLGIKNVHQQRDAAECLEMILNHISPEASKVFKGQMKNTIICNKTHIIIEETDPFLILPLSLKDANGGTTYNVESGIEDILQTKSLDEVYCEECDQCTDAISESQIEFPHILVLLLKRFDRNDKTNSYYKTDCCVRMPCRFQRKNQMYKLYGIVNHMGGLRGGHYTATILSEEDNTWYEFNDDRVRKVKEQPFANSVTHKSSTAYLLMYRERTRKEEGKPKVKMNGDPGEHPREDGGIHQRDGKIKPAKPKDLIGETNQQHHGHQIPKETQGDEDFPLLQNPETHIEVKVENGVPQSQSEAEPKSSTNTLKKRLIIALVACVGLSVVISVVIVTARHWFY